MLGPYGPEVAKDVLHTNLKSYLSNDICIVNGEDYFIRCVLYLPILGTSNEKLGYGVWSSVSEANFKKYRNTFNEPKQDQIAPWFGWLSNSLKGYPDSFKLKCNVFLQNDHKRPLIELQESDHPLSIEQHKGITIDRLFEIYALNGHEIKL